MYVKQFWRCFEETGNVETYLDLKEYEKLYNKHVDSSAMENSQEIDNDSLDRMK